MIVALNGVAMISQISICLLFLFISGSLAHAQTNSGFYTGGKINVVIGLGAGGAYDVHARLLSRHMGKHIEGNPVLVAQNMTGAGGLVMANWLYNVAPKDGSTFGAVANTMPALQVVGGKGVQFDARKFSWLGAVTPSIQTIGAWRERGVLTIEEAQKTEVVVAASSPGAIAYAFPKLLNEFIGTRFKIITGYQGVTQMSLAMERREVDAHANTWSGWKTSNREWLEQGKIVILAQINPKAVDLPGVPAVEDMVKGEDERKIVNFVVSGNRLGRPFATPPGVPADRVAILRSAFAATMNDPEFLQDANRLNVDVAPVLGVDIQRFVDITTSIDLRLAERAKPFLAD